MHGHEELGLDQVEHHLEFFPEGVPGDVNIRDLLVDHISALPVMEEDELVGIITSTDVMRVLLEAIGMQEDSVRLCVLVANRIGAVAEVSALLRDLDVNIQSLVTWPVRKHPGIHQLVLRLAGDDGPKAVAALNKNNMKVLTRYVKDLLPYLPDSV